jgi:hypothetical protein
LGSMPASVVGRARREASRPSRSTHHRWSWRSIVTRSAARSRARRGPDRARSHLRGGVFGGWWTRISPRPWRCVQWGPSAASRSRRHRTWAPSRRRIGDRWCGVRTPLDRAGIPDRGAMALGGSNHRSTDLGRATATRQPQGPPAASERTGGPFGRTQAPPGPRKTRRVCGRGRGDGEEASRTGKCPCRTGGSRPR